MACGKPVCLIALLATFVVSLASAGAAEPDRDALRAMRDQAQAIQERTQAAEPPDWLRTPTQAPAHAAGEAAGRQAGQRLREQVDQGQPEACAALGAECAPPDAAQPAPLGETLTLLVSRSLGESTLRAIFATAATEGVRVVFRGVAEGEPLMGFVREIHTLLQGLDSVPLVELDPTPFRETAAASVPLLVLSGPDGEIARVSGITSAAWLKDQVRAGHQGDLGTRGPVEAIAEPDMIEEIARRIQTLDMDALRERAVTGFWKQARFEHLPAADRPRERLLDPTVQAKADIRHPDGRLIVRAGETLNPLERMTFSRRLVMFDATIPAQVAQARALGDAPGSGQALYLATRFERERGWDGFQAVEDGLDAPVYLLTPDLRARFALERVPSTVEARDGRFVVREYPAERAE
jgi:conjugal transfer pilus assembly protein TraW